MLKGLKKSLSRRSSKSLRNGDDSQSNLEASSSDLLEEQGNNSRTWRKKSKRNFSKKNLEVSQSKLVAANGSGNENGNENKNSNSEQSLGLYRNLGGMSYGKGKGPDGRQQGPPPKLVKSKENTVTPSSTKLPTLPTILAQSSLASPLKPRPGSLPDEPLKKGRKLTVQQELEELRKKSLAKNISKDLQGRETGFVVENAATFSKKQKRLKKEWDAKQKESQNYLTNYRTTNSKASNTAPDHTKITSSKNPSSSGIDSFYLEQNKMNRQLKQQQKDAHTYMRKYRGHYTPSKTGAANANIDDRYYGDHQQTMDDLLRLAMDTPLPPELPEEDLSREHSWWGGSDGRGRVPTWWLLNTPHDLMSLESREEKRAQLRKLGYKDERVVLSPEQLDSLAIARPINIQEVSRQISSEESMRSIGIERIAGPKPFGEIALQESNAISEIEMTDEEPETAKYGDDVRVIGKVDTSAWIAAGASATRKNESQLEELEDSSQIDNYGTYILPSLDGTEDKSSENGLNTGGAQDVAGESVFDDAAGMLDGTSFDATEEIISDLADSKLDGVVADTADPRNFIGDGEFDLANLDNQSKSENSAMSSATSASAGTVEKPGAAVVGGTSVGKAALASGVAGEISSNPADSELEGVGINNAEIDPRSFIGDGEFERANLGNQRKNESSAVACAAASSGSEFGKLGTAVAGGASMGADALASGAAGEMIPNPTDSGLEGASINTAQIDPRSFTDAEFELANNLDSQSTSESSFVASAAPASAGEVVKMGATVAGGSALGAAALAAGSGFGSDSNSGKSPGRSSHIVAPGFIPPTNSASPILPTQSSSPTKIPHLRDNQATVGTTPGTDEHNGSQGDCDDQESSAIASAVSASADRAGRLDYTAEVGATMVAASLVTEGAFDHNGKDDTSQQVGSSSITALGADATNGAGDISSTAINAASIAGVINSPSSDRSDGFTTDDRDSVVAITFGEVDESSVVATNSKRSGSGTRVGDSAVDAGNSVDNSMGRSTDSTRMTSRDDEMIEISKTDAEPSGAVDEGVTGINSGENIDAIGCTQENNHASFQQKSDKVLAEISESDDPLTFDTNQSMDDIEINDAGTGKNALDRTSSTTIQDTPGTNPNLHSGGTSNSPKSATGDKNVRGDSLPSTALASAAGVAAGVGRAPLAERKTREEDGTNVRTSRPVNGTPMTPGSADEYSQAFDVNSESKTKTKWEQKQHVGNEKKPILETGGGERKEDIMNEQKKVSTHDGQENEMKNLLELELGKMEEYENESIVEGETFMLDDDDEPDLDSLLNADVGDVSDAAHSAHAPNEAEDPDLDDLLPACTGAFTSALQPTQSLDDDDDLDLDSLLSDNVGSPSSAMQPAHMLDGGWDPALDNLLSDDIGGSSSPMQPPGGQPVDAYAGTLGEHAAFTSEFGEERNFAASSVGSTMGNTLGEGFEYMSGTEADQAMEDMSNAMYEDELDALLGPDEFEVVKIVKVSHVPSTRKQSRPKSRGNRSTDSSMMSRESRSTAISRGSRATASSRVSKSTAVSRVSLSTTTSHASKSTTTSRGSKLPRVAGLHTRHAINFKDGKDGKSERNSTPKSNTSKTSRASLSPVTPPRRDRKSTSSRKTVAKKESPSKPYAFGSYFIPPDYMPSPTKSQSASPRSPGHRSPQKIALYARTESTSFAPGMCTGKWILDLHYRISGCERCLHFASQTERRKYERDGHHYRVCLVRGGCSRKCKLFPREPNEKPVRLCRKCFYDTHFLGHL